MNPTLPHLAGHPMVTDGGMETDLIFHHGIDLPCFASFPLLGDDAGRRLLRDYYFGYAEIAAAAGAGLLLESPTWRANPDWDAQLGYDVDALRGVDLAAIEFLLDLRQHFSDRVGTIAVSGMVGPRGDGYRPGTVVDPDEAADYHRPQLVAFAEAGADQAVAYTLTSPGEAIGIVRAARSVALPIAVSFTVETDGRLPSGTTLAAAVARVDAAPDYFMINCAHPRHVEAGLEAADPPPAWRQRILGLRSNASTLSHAELNTSTTLDDGDPIRFGPDHDRLRAAFPRLAVLGGCCGSDTRHVASLWGTGPC